MAAVGNSEQRQLLNGVSNYLLLSYQMVICFWTCMYMNHATYFKELADYYNNSRLNLNAMRGVSNLRREYDDPNSWVRAWVNNLQSVFRGKRVLEVASGAGKWTQFFADVAEQALATDQSSRLLNYARDLKLQKY